MRQRKLRTGKVSLVIFGTYLAICGMAYTPAPKPKPSKQFIKTTYVRPTGEQRWYASEKRKRQILAEIRRIRNEVREQAAAYKNRDKRKNVIYLSIKL